MQAIENARDAAELAAEERERLVRENDSLLSQLQQAITNNHDLTVQLIGLLPFSLKPCLLKCFSV